MADPSQSAPGSVPAFGATVTILFSDIRGFTDYTSQYGDEAAFRVLRHHNSIVREQIELFGGHVVKTQGDSFMVSFTTARGAILCAAAVQRAIEAANQDHAGTRIAVGIGINTGEAIREGGDFFGNAVNLAARICTAAGPGQVFISETTRFVAGKIEAIEYVDHGPHELKGFQEPQRLFEVNWTPGRWLVEGPAIGDAASEDPELVETVQIALGVLTRVLGVSYKDNPSFRPLLECQAKATDLRLKLSRAAAEPRGYSVERVKTEIAPFVDLLTMILDRDRLDDQRWTQAETAVSRTFGRPLATAAARGRLVIQGLEPRPAAAAAPSPEPPAPAPAIPEAPRRAAPRASPVTPLVAPPPPPDPRAAGVAWWMAAHEGWNAWKTSGMALAHALRAALVKHPHLLAVPIQQSGEHDEGRLASGYFLLLEHVEHLSPGFIGAVVEWAIAEAGGAYDSRTLGSKLYRMLVSAGHLEDTYGDFVKDVMIAAIPNPGLWADGGLIESDDATVVITRPSRTLGDLGEQTQSVTEPKERAAARRFAVTAQPLTARFFFLKTGPMRDPRDIELKLALDGEPSDRASYLTMRTGHILHSDARRVSSRGTIIPGLSRDYAGLWIAVFNPDPDKTGHYELSISTRGQSEGAPRGSTFSRLLRGPR